jgi:formylglycine-generating enzyme required for sulfatase activity
LEAKQAWQPLLLNWYQQAPDTGTRSAAGRALRQWGLPVREIASSPEPTKGRQWYVNSVGITMLRIGGGAFSRRYNWVRNSPTQQVRITRPFFLSDREISVGLYERFMGDTEYPYEKSKDWPGANKTISHTPDHPVQNVSWYDAVMFCNWLSRKEGLRHCYEPKKGTLQRSRGESGDTWELLLGANGYRLPTEGEWEYACRAGSATKYSHGDDDSLIGRYAVFGAATRTEPCASKLPNAWGLFDMHGNVFEYCQDWYASYEARAVVEDPTGPAVATRRVGRGGSYESDQNACTASYRDQPFPGYRSRHQGFRLARTVSSSHAVR